ncbi:MAG: L,D-transpeptidase family protein [Syntrophomonadaceae bacterium]|jgi:peptidoglycan hydrolase-like protein with peptidoglycan-binding domain|nr:L,D-transpeptidase family protein [Syntrophomonadaceae bacterium]
MIYATRFLRLQDDVISGPDVQILQYSLKRMGFYSGSVDGFFTRETEQAVTTFQISRFLPADGIVGPDTWIKLRIPFSVSIPYQPDYQNDLPLISIDITKRRLTFSRNGQPSRTYKVGIGKKSTPTPMGNWSVVQKSLNPGGPFGVRWMRLSIPWGGYGIHGTNNPKSIGKAYSHGCVRMFNEDVTELYDLTPIGTPVNIFGKAYTGRLLKLGTEGPDVKEVQLMLKKMGYYKYKSDGVFGIKTEEAVKRFQKDNGLIIDGIVGPQTRWALQKKQDISSKDIEP